MNEVASAAITWLQNREPENRSAVQIALNLLEGAASVTRAHQLRSYGAPIPAAGYRFEPRPLG